MKHRAFASLIVIILSVPGLSLAQTPATGGASSGETETTYDLGFKGGSLLPYGISGVREVLPLWGIKFGHSFSKTIRFEYDFDMANAKGVTYYIGYFSIRHDFSVLNTLPLYALFGLDYHYYKRKNKVVTSEEFPFRSVTGWHASVGWQNRLFASIWFRVDVRLGFSPGRQMTFTGGLIGRF